MRKPILPASCAALAAIFAGAMVQACAQGCYDMICEMHTLVSVDSEVEFPPGEYTVEVHGPTGTRTYACTWDGLPPAEDDIVPWDWCTPVGGDSGPRAGIAAHFINIPVERVSDEEPTESARIVVRSATEVLDVKVNIEHSGYTLGDSPECPVCLSGTAHVDWANRVAQP